MLRVPVVLHLVRSTGPYSTARTEAQARAVVADINRLWSPAMVEFEVVRVVTTHVPADAIAAALPAAAGETRKVDPSGFSKLSALDREALNFFFIGGMANAAATLGSVRGLLISDNPGPWQDRATTFSLGIHFGLAWKSKAEGDPNNVMTLGVNGREWRSDQIESVRTRLGQVFKIGLGAAPGVSMRAAVAPRSPLGSDAVIRKIPGRPKRPYLPRIIIPVKVHLVKSNEALSTSRPLEEVRRLFDLVNQVWRQASLEFEVAVMATTQLRPEELLPALPQDGRAPADCEPLARHKSFDDKAFNVYFADGFGECQAFRSRRIVLVPDRLAQPTWELFRQTCTRLAFILGLPVSKTRDGLMVNGTGLVLSAAECEEARMQVSSLTFARHSVEDSDQSAPPVPDDLTPAALPQEPLFIPVMLHLVDSTPAHKTTRTPAEVLAILDGANRIWSQQANLHFCVIGMSTKVIDGALLDKALQTKQPVPSGADPRLAKIAEVGSVQAQPSVMTKLSAHEPRALNLYFTHYVPRTNQAPYASLKLSFLSDEMTFDASTVVARTLGFLLGLGAVQGEERLMAGGSGAFLTGAEIERARARAMEHYYVDSQLLMSSLGDPTARARVAVPVHGHLVQSQGMYSTKRPGDRVQMLLNQTSRIWEQAGIDLQLVGLSYTAVNASSIEKALNPPHDPSLVMQAPGYVQRTINIYFMGWMPERDGCSFPEVGVVLLPDATSVNDYRAVAHEIGYVLGLEASGDPQRLMCMRANGEALRADEIIMARWHGARLAYQ
jgi:hypothetical protein